MDKYRETLRAMRGGIKKSGSYKGETVWESMGVDRMWGGKNVVWAADCRGFLTKIHEPIYADYGKPKSRFARLAVIKRGLQSGLSRSDMAPRPTKAKIPLVHFEEALRKHVLISPNHTLLERFIAYIPILRYYVLAKRGILYSRSSVKHHARVSEWCRDMRELADEHSAVPQKEGPVPIGEGSGARGSGAPKSQRDLVFGSRSFETVAFPVVLLSLVNKSRHRGVRDFVMVGLSATIIWGIVSGLLIVAGDQYLAAKVWVYMSARSWLGYSHGTEDLVEYLCWEFGTEAWYRAPPSAELLEGKTIPEGFPKVLEEVVDGKVIVHGCTLQHPGTGHMVSVVPLARTGVESHYWWAGERLKRCAAVGLFMYPKEAGPAEVSENLFLPMKYPNLMSVGVFERFLPIYHGAPPHPKIFGMWYGYLVRGPFAEMWIRMNTVAKAKSERSCAETIVARATLTHHVGCPHLVECTQAIYAQLIKAGYSKVAETYSCTTFDGPTACDSLLSIYPFLKHTLETEAS